MGHPGGVCYPTRPQVRVRMGHPGGFGLLPPVRKGAYGWGTRDSLLPPVRKGAYGWGTRQAGRVISHPSAGARTDGAPGRCGLLPTRPQGRVRMGHPAGAAVYPHPSARARTDGAPGEGGYLPPVRKCAYGWGTPGFVLSHPSARARTDGAPGAVVLLPPVRKGAYGWGTRRCCYSHPSARARTDGAPGDVRYFPTRPQERVRMGHPGFVTPTRPQLRVRMGHPGFVMPRVCEGACGWGSRFFVGCGDLGCGWFVYALTIGNQTYRGKSGWQFFASEEDLERYGRKFSGRQAVSCCTAVDGCIGAGVYGDDGPGAGDAAAAASGRACCGEHGCC